VLAAAEGADHPGIEGGEISITADLGWEGGEIVLHHLGAGNTGVNAAQGSERDPEKTIPLGGGGGGCGGILDKREATTETTETTEELSGGGPLFDQVPKVAEG